MINKKEEEKKKETKLTKSIKEKLKICQKEKDEYLAGWQREKANFLNYKKEGGKEMEKIIKYINQRLILKILLTLDTIFLAESNMPKELKEDEWVNGILQTKNQLQSILKEEGVEEIETNDRKFDPVFDEAIEEVQKDGIESGMIIEEIKKGYKIGDRVIRPSQVRIAK
ncbi:MAG: nucleotide exchange factor GrpE [Patescibacteria group bacterium]|nr:nucleotide exchange factor GrpE [Patescibacteria group bacterium]